MTTQTKNYIEVSDIIAFRCECKKCGVALTFPADKDMASSTKDCPHCGSGWTRLGQSTNEVFVVELANKINQLCMLLPHMGFNLTLEVKEEPKP